MKCRRALSRALPIRREETWATRLGIAAEHSTADGGAVRMAWKRTGRPAVELRGPYRVSTGTARVTVPVKASRPLGSDHAGRSRSLTALAGASHRADLHRGAAAVRDGQ
ncbi:hypothetical protein GCM10010441_19910 [Kitasatospora paracochleata]